jgi:hypothetical protein
MMVLPNAILALYYGWRRKPEVVYTSQVGDAHICIPLCVGIFALHQTLELPARLPDRRLSAGRGDRGASALHCDHGKAATHRGFRAGGSLRVLSESRIAC